MIRDEFIKQKEEKNLSNKELQGIRSKGERVFYTTEISKLSDSKKILTFTSIIVLVMLVAVTIPLVLGYIADGFYESVFWPTVIVIAFYVLLIIYFAVILPSMNRRIKKYLQALEEVRQKDIQKQQMIYKNYNK